MKMLLAVLLVSALALWPLPGGYAASGKPSMPLKISYPVDLTANSRLCNSGREVSEFDSADAANAEAGRPQATFVYWSNAPLRKDKPVVVGLWHWDVLELEWLFDLDRNGYADEVLTSDEAQEKYGNFCGAVDKAQ